ncbi:MAG: hypothetical protein KAS32_15230 [Candidatus Peribacteraceae bacterium]|nr:hypothetical protein [Candidatus Peribacteraceae bacterium]
MTTTLKKRNNVEEVYLDKAVFVRAKDGQINRIKTSMALTTADKTLVNIIKPKKAWNDLPAKPGVWTPSAIGYRQIGARCGLVYRHPDEVIVDGAVMANPCWSADKKTCYSRTQVGGYTILGQPVIVDRTVELSVHRYHVQDLLSKVKMKNNGVMTNAAFFKMFPYRGEDERGCLLGEPAEGDWGGYQLDSAMVLWVRTDNNPNIYYWSQEMNNRVKNALRTVQTFSDRNAVAAHPAVPAKLHFEQDNVNIVCTSWFAKEGNITFDLLENHKEVELIEGGDNLNKDIEPEIIKEEEELAVTDPGEVVEKPEETEELKIVITSPTAHKTEKQRRKQMLLFVDKCRADKDPEFVKRAFEDLSYEVDINAAHMETEALERLVGNLERE